MGDTPIDVIVSGLGLAGLLAVAGAWSRAVRPRGLPHLGVGAAAGVAMLVATRASGLSAALTVVVVVFVGAGGADLARRLDRRVLEVAGQDPRRTPLLADVAVLGAALAVAVALRPPLAIPFPFGPLGGRPSLIPAVLALLLGVVVAWLISQGIGATATWWVAGAVTAATAMLAGGVLGGGIGALGALPTMPDTAGLAFRAAAAGLVGRSSPAHAAVAGAGLGMAESLLWLVGPDGRLSILPAVVAAIVGLLAMREPMARLDRGTNTP